MILQGTLVNIVAVLIGSTIGMVVGSRLPQRVVKSVFQAIGLFTIVIGIVMALKGSEMLVIVFSLIIGTIIGELLRIDESTERMSAKIKRILKVGNPHFSEGLITSFLLFCMGAMTILGAIDEGLGNGSEILFTKSMMDGFSSMALASVMGVGVTFSIVPMLIYQGGITLLAYWLGDFMAQQIISELTAVGGILLIGLGINILEIKQLKIMNMLPALLLVILFTWIKISYFPN
ncbi:DUF554 domain-containing protein [Carboxylicivirga caseinilyticus]|uniref:DUF554 domain-containing protein n=1 Tax=Carboxylicivirga caseinilyticus TaxID=3417572 RepID=UPI003D33D5A5|nr:DUF554 domain-containing protein [Marinilabiliaceae bacterium A049]